MCLAQGHNTLTPVVIEPRTSRFGDRRSTTTPPRSLVSQNMHSAYIRYIKVQVGNDQEIVQSERNSHSINRGFGNN